MEQPRCLQCNAIHAGSVMQSIQDACNVMQAFQDALTSKCERSIALRPQLLNMHNSITASANMFVDSLKDPTNNGKMTRQSNYGCLTIKPRRGVSRILPTQLHRFPCKASKLCGIPPWPHHHHATMHAWRIMLHHVANWDTTFPRPPTLRFNLAHADTARKL